MVACSPAPPPRKRDRLAARGLRSTKTRLRPEEWGLRQCACGRLQCATLGEGSCHVSYVFVHMIDKCFEQSTMTAQPGGSCLWIMSIHITRRSYYWKQITWSSMNSLLFQPIVPYMQYPTNASAFFSTIRPARHLVILSQVAILPLASPLRFGNILLLLQGTENI